MSAPAPDPATPLGIICGGGSLPFAVADAALRQGRAVRLFAFTGWAWPEDVARYPHDWVGVGELGRLCRLARAAGCRDLVCIGAVQRVPLHSLRLDWTTLRLLPRLYRLARAGDNRLLSGLSGMFEERGFRLVGAHEIAPEILMPEGALGARGADARALGEARRGFAVLRALGPFDVGQAAVVVGERVVAIEGAEGTDAMLARVAELRASGRVADPRGTGVLVKAPKPGQDRRLDLPSIGQATVERAHKAALAGIVVEAGSVIVAEAAAMAAAADAAGLFVVGIRAEPPPP